ncbi:MAG: dihydrofolate reductase family protein [Xanthomonadales bacterium]|nr:dihydrofolate reductase family protein [Xanthomonadales bacterium]
MASVAPRRGPGRRSARSRVCLCCSCPRCSSPSSPSFAAYVGCSHHAPKAVHVLVNRNRRSGDPFTDWIKSVQKFVVSDTLTANDAIYNPTTIIHGADFLRTVSELRARPGGYIYFYGSATMVRSLLAADLVDELLLTIEPIVLGGGKTIFAENGKTLPFALESTAKASTGAQVCR